MEKVFQLAKVKYVVMTNIPFVKQETEKWLQGKGTSKRFKSALRIDPVLSGVCSVRLSTDEATGFGVISFMSQATGTLLTLPPVWCSGMGAVV